MTTAEWLGSLGVALLLLAFGLNLFGWLSRASRRYQGLNALGAGLACYARHGESTSCRSSCWREPGRWSRWRHCYVPDSRQPSATTHNCWATRAKVLPFVWRLAQFSFHNVGRLTVSAVTGRPV